MNENEKTSLYLKHEKLLKKQAYKAAREHMVMYAVDDLCQEASVAWCKAVNTFDPDRGASLSTYAWAVVSNQLRHAVDAIVRNATTSLDNWGVADAPIEVSVAESAYEITDARIALDDDERAVFDEAMTREHKSVESIVRRMRERGWSFRRARNACKSMKQKIAV
jgi:RNA polymerase sigma factor (sigma-70 family)